MALVLGQRKAAPDRPAACARGTPDEVAGASRLCTVSNVLHGNLELTLETAFDQP